MKIGSDALVIGDGRFPWNARPVRHHTEHVCFVLSFIANAVLTKLLVHEKNAVIKPYSRVLLLNQAFDYFYTIMSIFVEAELEMNEGCYILIVNGIPRKWSPSVQMVLVNVWLASCAAVCIVSPAEFIFRYCLVVKNYTLSIKEVMGMGVVVVFIASANGFCTYLACYSSSDAQASFEHLMADPIWTQDGEHASFFVAQFSNVFMQMFLFCAAIEDTCVILILTISTWASLSVLAKNRKHMSKKVRFMQSQINRLMFAEVISLFTTFVIPMGLVIAFLYLKVKFVGFGVVLSIALSWIPTVKPITTIFLVAPYRRQLFGKLLRRPRIASSRPDISSIAAVKSYWKPEPSLNKLALSGAQMNLSNNIA